MEDQVPDFSCSRPAQDRLLRRGRQPRRDIGLSRQQGVALPTVRPLDFFHYTPMLRTLEPYALRLGIEPETVEEMRDLANYFIAESIDGDTEKKLC